MRPDLKKWSEVGEQNAPKKDELPRYFLSTQNEIFDEFMKIIDTAGQAVADEVWELVQMLATNEKRYKQVLKIEFGNKDGKVDWAKFFDTSSAYNLLYSLQIVQAVISDGNTDNKRATCTNPEKFSTSKLYGKHYPTPEELEASENNAEDINNVGLNDLDLKKQLSSTSDNNQELRLYWAQNFV